MKHTDDIYGGHQAHQQQQPAAQKHGEPEPEQWRKEYLKHKFWSFLLSMIVFIFIAGMAWLMIHTYMKQQNKAKATLVAESALSRETGSVPRFGLESETEWVLDFDETLLGGDEQPVENAEFSTRWLKAAAYYTINAEQAFTLRKFDQAIANYKKALRIFPDLKGIHSQLGNIYLAQQNYKEAIKELEKSLSEQDTPDWRTLVNLGAACMQTEAFEKAEQYLQQALTEHPELPEVQKNLALLYKEMKRPEESIRYFERYLALRPNDIATTQLYTVYLTANAKWDKAAGLLRKLNESAPDVAPLFFLRAQVELQLGNQEAAISALQRGIRLVDSSYAIGWMSKSDFDEIRNTTAFQQLIDQVDLQIQPGVK